MKKKNNEAPLVDPAAENSVMTPIIPDEPNGGQSEPPAYDPPAPAPEPAKRTRRTKAVIEAERIANLDPITAMAAGMERHDKAVKEAEDDFETARQTVEAAKSARESFRDEHRAKVQAHLDAEEAARQAYIAKGKALIGD